MSRGAFKPTFGLIITTLCGGLTPALAEPLTLDQAVKQALASHPELRAARSQAQAEESMVTSKRWLESPSIGLMREKNMTPGMEHMDTWSISQEIAFPAKYFSRGSEQRAKALAMQASAEGKALAVRAGAITSYYNLAAAQQITKLLSAQKETLREIARTAEARRATGAVSQQDEMKAHTEQTMLERDLIMIEEELTSAQAALAAALGEAALDPAKLELPRQEPAVPKPQAELQAKVAELLPRNSRMVAEATAARKGAESRKNLAYLEYAPDFMLRYRKPFSGPSNAYEAELGFSIPLWFPLKQAPEVSAARAELSAAEASVDRALITELTDARMLAARVQANEKSLALYARGLIPQATSTLNSSRAAYRAGRTNFMDLLDSERSLYAVRISYYRLLAQYVTDLARLEQVVGTSLSDLPYQLPSSSGDSK